MKTQFDKELIQLYVDEYQREIEGCLPDLVGFNPGEDDRDTISDFAADFICDAEPSRGHIPEMREAANIIANFYC